MKKNEESGGAVEYLVRKAMESDLPRIEEIYACAREFMARTGNPNQWGKTHPPHDCLVDDIEKGLLNVITADDTIHGVFFFVIGDDPSYAYIEDGDWKYKEAYGTIHRIASDGSGGILQTAVDHCLEMIRNIRIDTHHDNVVMQKAVKKLGFEKSGIIYVEDGSPRIAYELYK